MDVYLFVLVVKWYGKFELVYKDNGNPAAYTEWKDAWDFLKEMQKWNPDAEYDVIQKRVTFEIN